MGVLLIIAVAVVAAENIELEPVRDLYSQNCGQHNQSAGGSRAICQTYPYCVWDGTAGTCHNDPCYKWIDDDAAIGGNGCGTASGGGLTNLPCIVRTYETYTPDCSTGTVATKKFCSGQDTPPTMTNCAYEYLKSNKTACPAYFCGKGTPYTGFDICMDVSGGGCPSNLICECLTETYCALNPYCYVANHTCISDLCTVHTDDEGGCASFNDVHTAAPGLYSAISDPCMKFDVYDGSPSHANGDTIPRCVNSQRNKTPNKCYELWNGYTTTGSSPCIAYTLPKCAENTECVAQTNTSGPYKDYYCGDAQHTASSVLVHAPAMVMIALSVLAFLL